MGCLGERSGGVSVANENALYRGRRVAVLVSRCAILALCRPSAPFYGIAIRMYANDHAPPHFHVRYGEHWAVVSIESGDIIHGSLPPTARRLVSEWASMHRDALMENWTLCQTDEQPRKIQPLT